MVSCPKHDVLRFNIGEGLRSVPLQIGTFPLIDVETNTEIPNPIYEYNIQPGSPLRAGVYDLTITAYNIHEPTLRDVCPLTVWVSQTHSLFSYCPTEIIQYIEEGKYTVPAKYTYSVFSNTGATAYLHSGPAVHDELRAGNYTVVMRAKDNQLNISECVFPIRVSRARAYPHHHFGDEHEEYHLPLGWKSGNPYENDTRNHHHGHHGVEHEHSHFHGIPELYNHHGQVVGHPTVLHGSYHTRENLHHLHNPAHPESRVHSHHGNHGHHGHLGLHHGSHYTNHIVNHGLHHFGHHDGHHGSHHGHHGNHFGHHDGHHGSHHGHHGDHNEVGHHGYHHGAAHVGPHYNSGRGFYHKNTSDMGGRLTYVDEKPHGHGGHLHNVLPHRHPNLDPNHKIINVDHTHAKHSHPEHWESDAPCTQKDSSNCAGFTDVDIDFYGTTTRAPEARPTVRTAIRAAEGQKKKKPQLAIFS